MFSIILIKKHFYPNIILSLGKILAFVLFAKGMFLTQLE